MRIIAGDYKGRHLLAPNDNKVRPTTDKVKEAIFSMLSYRTEDAVVIDLFAGTGNLGLEALSRGAARVYFGDHARSSLALVKQNVALCGAEDKSVILFGNYADVLSRIREKADIIFLDPPYGKDLIEDCFSHIAEGDLLKEDGLIIAEHDRNETLPELLAGFYKIKEKRYSRITVSVYGSNI